MCTKKLFKWMIFAYYYGLVSKQITTLRYCNCSKSWPEGMVAASIVLSVTHRRYVGLLLSRMLIVYFNVIILPVCFQSLLASIAPFSRLSSVALCAALARRFGPNALLIWHTRSDVSQLRAAVLQSSAFCSVTLFLQRLLWVVHSN